MIKPTATAFYKSKPMFHHIPLAAKTWHSRPGSITFVFEPAERIRQTPSQIEPMLGVPEQVIGPIVEREFENRKGVACRRLNIKRKMCGVCDGFRTSSPYGLQWNDFRICDP